MLILSNLNPIKVQDIPALIAAAIYSKPENQIVSHLFKITTDVHGNQRREQLEEKDWAILEKIWSSLPRFNEEWPCLRKAHSTLPTLNPALPAADWEKYQEAYNQYFPKSQNWQLEPILEDLEHHARRSATEKKQAEDLFYNIKMGTLTVRDGLTKSPIRDVPEDQLRNAEITVEELNKYVSPLGITISFQALEAFPEQEKIITAGLKEPKITSPNLTECESIPGKLPRTANGIVAIEAAWMLEKKLHRRADREEVMEQLCIWAENGEKAIVLKAPGKNRRSVHWITSNGDAKSYDLYALGKTLKKWNDSRNRRSR